MAKVLRKSGEIPFTRYWCKQLNDMFGGSIEIIAHVAGTYSKLGMPDRQIVHKYWVGWLEFKGVSTPIKDHQISKMRQLNYIRPGCAFIARQQSDRMSTLMIENEDGQILFTTDCPKELIMWLGKIGR